MTVRSLIGICGHSAGRLPQRDPTRFGTADDTTPEESFYAAQPVFNNAARTGTPWAPEAGCWGTSPHGSASSSIGRAAGELDPSLGPARVTGAGVALLRNEILFVHGAAP